MRTALHLLLASAMAALAQQAQNPSPMQDSTRAHQRVEKAEATGRRVTLSTGTLLLPAGARLRAQMPLYVHFHGAGWLAEWSATHARRGAVVLSVNLGAGSGVYRRAFADPQAFPRLLEEAARALDAGRPPKFRPVVLSGFSAGYGAIGEILKSPANAEQVDCVVLADGLHTGYAPEKTPGPLDPAPLAPFVDFARRAAAGRKRMVVTHSEIFPGTYASTTETADFLLSALGVRRRPVVRWGPLGMQQLSEARAGGFRLLGFAGNSAPDHVDHFHALERWLRMCR